MATLGNGMVSALPALKLGIYGHIDPQFSGMAPSTPTISLGAYTHVDPQFQGLVPSSLTRVSGAGTGSYFTPTRVRYWVRGTSGSWKPVSAVKARGATTFQSLIGKKVYTGSTWKTIS